MGGYRDDHETKVRTLSKSVILGLVLIPFVLMLGSCVFVFMIARG